MKRIKMTNNYMYKMFTEGELHFIDLVEKQEELDYEGYIRDKKIETILEVSIRLIAPSLNDSI